MAVETYNLEDTELYLYRNVPIADGMVPVWQSPQEQFDNWQQYATHRSVNTLYISGSQGNLQLNIDPSVIVGTDYISFINRYFENKIYYARVTNTEVIANSVVNVDFQIDDFQTYMFDFQMRGGVVLREHLTEEDHRKALANPWRDDVAELFTDEGFSLTSAEEVTYKRPDALNVSRNAIAPYRGSDPDIAYQFTPEESDGVPGLVEVIGEDTIVRNDRTTPYGNLTGDFAIVAEITDNLVNAYYRWYDKDFLGGLVRDEGKFDRFLDSSRGLAYSSDVKLMVLSNTSSTPGATGGDYRSNIAAHFIARALEEGHSPDLLNVYVLPKSVMNYALGAYYYMNNRRPAGVSDSMRATKDPRHEINVPKYSDLYGYVNPKLERFPFRYLRLNSPTGDDKEFVIEKFKGARPVIALFSELNGSPAMHAAPMGYNGHSLDLPNRLTYEGFPHLPASSDGYRSYIRARAAALLENDTQNAKRARDMTEINNAKAKNFNLFDPGTWLPSIQAVGERAGGAVSMVRNTLAGDPRQGLEDAGAARFERMQLNQAEEIIDGKMPTETFTGEEAPGGTFAVPRGLAAGMGEFIAGDTAGDMFMMLNRMQFEAIVVTYQREVIKAYSDFLEAYGYRSDSIKQPRVMDYIRGGAGPRFVELDGLTFTYAQTEKVKIYGVTPGAAANIAAIFNGGARFTKGM